MSNPQPEDSPLTVAARLSRTLHVVLGEDAAADMMTWMQGVESGRSELRELHDLYVTRTDARFDKIDARFERVDAQFETLRHRLEAKIDQRFAELIKWSFLFWCGSIIAALLAQRLR